MTKEKFKKVIEVIGLPRLIVSTFFLAIVITAAVCGIDVASFFSSTLQYWGMWVILVLAMIPSIKCGIGPNFGVSLGIVSGLLGALLAVEFNIVSFAGPWGSMLFAIVVSAVIAWFVGVGYGKILNLVKGSEMTVTTYIGYSIIYLMCIVWFRAPFSNGEIKWPVGGAGVRNSVAMETSFGYLLNDFLGFNIGPVYIPTGIILFGLMMCAIVHLFFRTKTGMAITAAGANPTFARASGINVDKMRITGMAVSTVLGAIGIVIYTQGFGFLQAYVDDAVKTFIAENHANIGKIVCFGTSAMMQSMKKPVRKAAEAFGVSVAEEEFHCRGTFGILHKGRPNENDLLQAAAFAADLVQ